MWNDSPHRPPCARPVVAGQPARHYLAEWASAKGHFIASRHFLPTCYTDFYMEVLDEKVFAAFLHK
jgi:hypothetical protein